MAFVSPKMGLRVWNQLSDLYDHDQLADNWAKVDYHDHTPGRGVPIPTEGIADGAITAPKLASSIPSPEPAFSSYKQIITSQSLATSGVALASGTTYMLGEGLNAAVLPGGATAGGSVIYLDPADYTAGTRSIKYRLRASLQTNATPPTSTFTVGFYPVTAVAGGAGVNGITLGSVAATVAFAAPAASTSFQVTSSDFPAPAAGYYAFAVAVTTANMAAGSAVAIRAILQYRQV